MNTDNKTLHRTAIQLPPCLIVAASMQGVANGCCVDGGEHNTIKYSFGRSR